MPQSISDNAGTNVTRCRSGELYGQDSRTPFLIDELRLAVFWLLAITAMGFSPILAYVFSLLNGKCGIAGWSWIFVCDLFSISTITETISQIIEGAATLFLGILAWFFLPDFPDRNCFLTPQETAIILKRIEEDRGDSIPDPLTRQKVFTHLCDWTLWASGIGYRGRFNFRAYCLLN
jgi:hypothetical protein